MSQLSVWKDTGEILFDTNLICYGLVKSGYMQFLGAWSRKTLRSTNLDPNDGASWTTSSWQGAENSNNDGIWGFTVYNAISPIVFLTGSGCLVGTSVTGSAVTFYYTCADTSTRFYCFDLMADNIGGSTFLKTYDTAQRITFNSLQPPLNILAAVQPPGPGAVDQFGRPTTTYAGGANRVRGTPLSRPTQTDSYINIPLGGEEYAAYLPWSRTCGTYDFLAGGTTFAAQYGMSEGAYGYAGGITFMFGAAGGTTTSRPNTSGWSAPISFFNIPTDRYPVALVIRTSDLIFPYN